MTPSRRALVRPVVLALTIAAVPVAIVPLSAQTQRPIPVAGFIHCCPQN